MTYAAKLSGGEGRLDWREPARGWTAGARLHALARRLRSSAAGERIKVLAARSGAAAGGAGQVLDAAPTVACGEGALRLVTVQRAGKAPWRRRTSCAASAGAGPGCLCRTATGAMTRYKLTLEYDGAAFVGWQRQDNGPSVQAALEEAVPASAASASRSTAPGAPTPGSMPWARSRTSTWTRRPRPRPCATRSTPTSSRAGRGADGRGRGGRFPRPLLGERRRYLYRIVNRRRAAGAGRGRAWFVPRPLDAAAMHAAGQVLVGKHDFTSFRASECQAKSPVKTLDRSRSRATARRSRSSRRALLPAPPGAQHGRHA